MRFWRSTFRLVQDVTSLGGTYRLRDNNEKLKQLKEIYEHVCLQISECNSEIVALVAVVQKRVLASDRLLGKAEKILNPLKYKGDLAIGSDLAFGKNSPFPAAARTAKNSTVDSVAGTYASTVVGAGAGTAAAAGSWSAVQVLAHASTGTAMAGLHGAAAANAGWAWFGGGSLAVGGGGMTLGHLVLPGIGTAVAITVSATMSHSEANKINKYCSELEIANLKNSSTLSATKSNLNHLQNLDTRLNVENSVFADVLREARQKLFRFGYFSHVWRLIRHWFHGYYYKREEFVYIDRVSAAALKFMAAFKNR